MSKKMNLKNKKKKKHIIKKSLFIMTFLLSIFFTIRLLASISIKNQQDEFLTFLLENQNIYLEDKRQGFSYFHKMMMKLLNIDLASPLTFLNRDYKGLTSNTVVKLKKSETNKKIETKIKSEKTKKIIGIVENIALIILFLLCISDLSASGYNPFIYFRF